MQSPRIGLTRNVASLPPRVFSTLKKIFATIHPYLTSDTGLLTLQRERQGKKFRQQILYLVVEACGRGLLASLAPSTSSKDRQKRGIR